MTERPILFSAPMVRAILDGRKTQTRRIVNMRGVDYIGPAGCENDPNCWGWADQYGDWYVIGRGHPYPGMLNDGDTSSIVSPYGIPGDRLWVRETWAIDAPLKQVRRELEDAMPGLGHGPYFRADPDQQGPNGLTWRPSIHMPRWASRITLEVTSVRVERLQDISEEDARAEGITREYRARRHGGEYLFGAPGELCTNPYGDHEHGPARHSTAAAAFQALWDSINAKRAPWSSNPWVWVIEFRRLP